MSHTVQLATERLLLKPIEKGHAEAIFRYRSDSLTNRYQGWIPNDVEDAVSFIANRTFPEINVNGTWFQLVVTLRATGEIIGDIGMHFPGNRNEQVELGCTIARDHQCKGYAKEALTEVVSYLFDRLEKRRLIAFIDPANIPSIKLFESLGFIREDHSRESMPPEESRAGDLLYSLPGK